jgi:predicted amidohydrolase YtcJ
LRALAEYRANLPPTEIASEARHQADLAARECLSKGITTFQDAGSPLPTVDLLKSMAEENKLGLRL